MNWQELSADSHYQTAVAVRQAVENGNIREAYYGITELIEALSRSERRALRSQLIRLMMHIVKWKSQPGRRSRSWIASISNARREINDIRKETPSLNKNVISDMWDDCLNAAILDAEGEMNKASEISELAWKDVFEEEYRIRN